MEKRDIKDTFALEYLTVSDITFYKTDGELLGAKCGDYNGRVRLYRAFPMSAADSFISVRKPGEDSEEIGIIETLAGFSAEQLELIQKELDMMYFMPVIEQVYDVSEDFGSSFWHVRTDRGERKFTLRDISNNLIFAKNNELIIIDTDGNRYLIKNLAALGKKAARILDMWL